MKSHVLPGYVTAEGKVVAKPIIIELDDDGNVASHRPLDGHEPPFTTPLNALLMLDGNQLRAGSPIFLAEASAKAMS